MNRRTFLNRLIIAIGCLAGMGWFATRPKPIVSTDWDLAFEKLYDLKPYQGFKNDPFPGTVIAFDEDGYKYWADPTNLGINNERTFKRKRINDVRSRGDPPNGLFSPVCGKT